VRSKTAPVTATSVRHGNTTPRDET